MHVQENPSSARCRFWRCSSASGVWPELASGMLWDRNVQGSIACAWPVDSSARENIHVAVMHELKIVWIVQVVRTSASLGAADPVSSDYPERKSSWHDGSMLSPPHNHMSPLFAVFSDAEFVPETAPVDSQSQHGRHCL